MIHDCLAKELARRKNYQLSVRPSIRLCLVRHLTFTGMCPAPWECQRKLVINITLCQTSCPLRTVYYL